MPSLFGRKKAVSPADKDEKRPLAYAQSSYAPSINSSLASTYEPSISPSTMTLQSEDDDKTLVGDDEKLNKRAEGAGLQQGIDEPDFTRPKTPPKGSNYNEWSSYRDLPRDHPVFRYPDAMREKMYAKGVGMSSYRPGEVVQMLHVKLICNFRSSREGRDGSRTFGQSLWGPYW
jgi:hypothetical protein